MAPGDGGGDCDIMILCLTLLFVLGVMAAGSSGVVNLFICRANSSILHTALYQVACIDPAKARDRTVTGLVTVPLEDQLFTVP